MTPPPPCNLRAAYLAPRALHYAANLLTLVRGTVPPWQSDDDTDGRIAKVYQVNAAASTGALRLLGHSVDRVYGTISFNISALPATAIDMFLCDQSNHSMTQDDRVSGPTTYCSQSANSRLLRGWSNCLATR